MYRRPARPVAREARPRAATSAQREAGTRPSGPVPVARATDSGPGCAPGQGDERGHFDSIPRQSAGKGSSPEPHTYVLDTSVLLADPYAILRFAEHEVVLPVVVITELEGKRHHPELGYFARAALRLLDELRLDHGRLDALLPVGDQGGTVRVELNHTDHDVLPAGFRLGDNDTRILAVARNLAADGRR